MLYLKLLSGFLLFSFFNFAQMPQEICHDSDVDLFLPSFNSRSSTNPVTAVYTFILPNNKQLVYASVYHTCDMEGLTAQTIKNTIELFKPDLCLIEGFENTEGMNPQRILDLAEKESLTGKCADVLYAAKLCYDNGISFMGTHANEATYLKPLQERGFDVRDLVFYSLVQQIPYWHMLDKMKNEDLKIQFEDFMKGPISEWLQIPPVSYTYEDFLDWHEEHMGKSYCPSEDFINGLSLLPYLGDDATIYEKMSAYIVLIREINILNILKNSLENYDKVFIILGASHYEWEEKFLSTLYGDPVNIQMIETSGY
jgi:hypothetical protein